ncbi:MULTISPECIES: hypothetical protein [Bacteroidales]|uniref:DUF3450 domain-containing protein n=1 Tax=Bacteroides stercorirosoris TaxID=871324 RepID=A0A1M6BLT4_9BACE|nr:MULTISPECIES: hypothetical protein [Bacteroidales]MBR8703031.1 hypothetical protein [Porphyromonas levii]SHI49689.1 hypothetical protein SAMN05444350_10354 [Bacteroides stercorirosoris]
MKKFSILLFSVVMFPLGINAQEQDTLKNTVEVVAETPVEVIKVDSLQHEIDRLKGLIAQYKQSETSLNGKLYDYEQTIKVQNKKIERLNSYLLFADTIVARLSNDCLRKKYDQNRVNQAMENFEKMYSPELKSKFGRLRFLLNEYGKFTQELNAIFIEAQNDKGLGNPFTGQKQALTYIDKIKNTRYYRDVYSENWTIPYLNNLIDKCFETIKVFNPKESKELHLLELMN